MGLYIFNTEYLIGDSVIIKTRDGQKISGQIIDIYNTADGYHTSPIISLLIYSGTELYDIEDYMILDIRYS